MTHRPALLVVLLVLLPVAALAVAVAPRPAVGADDDAPLRKALREIVAKLAKGEKGPRLGQKGTAATADAKGSAHVAGTHVLPLSATPYAPEGDWRGTVSFMTDEDLEVPLDSIDVVLLCPKYDKRTMERYLVVLGDEHGMTLEPDGEEEGVFWSEGSEELELCVLLGDEVIAIYANTVED